MKDDTIILLGATIMGGILLYKTLGEPLNKTGSGVATGVSGLGQGLSDVSTSIGDVAKDLSTVTNPIKAVTDKLTDNINQLPTIEQAGSSIWSGISRWADCYFAGNCGGKDLATTKSTIPNNTLPQWSSNMTPQSYAFEGAAYSSLTTGRGKSLSLTSFPSTVTANTQTPTYQAKSNSTTKTLSPSRVSNIIKLPSLKSNVIFRRA